MQTQCPHCETKFRVTETQIHVADGFVRCGVCEEVFNAIEVASQQKHQPSLLSASHSEDHSTAVTEENEQPEIVHNQNHEQNIDLESELNEPIEIQADNESVYFNETITSDESRKDTFDFFNEETSESLQHVVPDEFRDSHSSRSSSVIHTVLWSTATLLLTTTLIIEYIWFNRDQFNQVPELQTGIEKLCQQIECKNFSMRDPDKIELISRNIYSHPDEKDALMVNVTMKNNADFAQPYPVMQINFSDIRGGIVAARRFFPAEYLDIEYQQNNAEHLRLLQPNTSASLTLEILDPGKQAMTYEFNFL